MGKHRTRRLFSLFAILCFAISILSSCGDRPTTLILNVEFDTASLTFPPTAFPGNTADISALLFIRIMLNDVAGTVVWSNEASPYVITDLEDGMVYRYVMTLDDAILTDASNLYMIDAYFYDDAFVIGPAIDPTDAGDAERFTKAAVPAASSPPLYDPDLHLVTNIQIAPGDVKTLRLKTLLDFP
jgi:hypothetical protein